MTKETKKAKAANKRYSELMMQTPSDDPSVCLECRRKKCSGGRRCYLAEKARAGR